MRRPKTRFRVQLGQGYYLQGVEKHAGLANGWGPLEASSPLTKKEADKLVAWFNSRGVKATLAEV